MSDNIEEIDSDSSSLALKVLALELAKDQKRKAKSTSTHSGGDESEDSNTSDETDSPNRGATNLEGITEFTSQPEPNKNTTSSPEERQTLFFFQIEDKTQSTPFRPEDPENYNRGFPVNSSGQIDSIFISAQSNTFRVMLEIDGDKILDNASWSELNSISQELAHVGAYQESGGNYILSISDYPFNETLDLSIRPISETVFDYIRVELMLDEYTTGTE